MFTLVTELPPLGQVVGSLVEDVYLSISTIGPHDLLSNGFADPDLLHQVSERRKLVLPLLWRYYLDDAGFHSVGIDLLHLVITQVSSANTARSCGGSGSGSGGASSTYEFLEVLELGHVGLEDWNCARPMVRDHFANVFVNVFVILGGLLGGGLGVEERHMARLKGRILDVAQFRVIAAIELHGAVAVGRGMQADVFGGWVRLCIAGEHWSGFPMRLSVVMRVGIVGRARLAVVEHCRGLVSCKLRRSRFDRHGRDWDATCDQRGNWISSSTQAAGRSGSVETASISAECEVESRGDSSSSSGATFVGRLSFWDMLVARAEPGRACSLVGLQECQVEG